MTLRYFGTDGIRGRVGEGLISADFVLRLGNALGQVLVRRYPDRYPVVVIGKDPRISGYMFESALQAGLVSAGVNVQLFGPMPTPAVAFLTRTLDADTGIVISASHNPYFDNGIKFFSADGEKLDDEMEAEIEAAMDSPFLTVESKKLGKAARTRDVVGRYIEFCKATVPRKFNLHGLKIVIDCANGATYHIAPLLFHELGADVTVIGAQPNGLNINDGVGSMHLEGIAEKVKEVNADLGIAFDGDGDRVLMVDHNGTHVDGDDLLYILGKAWSESGRLQGPVVGTLMTNYGLEQAFERDHIDFVRIDKVGDRHVHKTLVENAGILGGETSGHVLCLDRTGTGDAIISALQVLEVLNQKGISLREALSGMNKMPQKTVNVRISGGASAIVNSESVQAALALAKTQIKGHGRAFLRPSGTEPVIRVTVEADNATLMESTVITLAEAVKKAV